MKDISERLDYIETVAEEITLGTGLKTTMIGQTILISTIAGKIKFRPLYGKLMTDYYAFIYKYGLVLTDYGLENKLKEENE